MTSPARSGAALVAEPCEAEGLAPLPPPFGPEPDSLAGSTVGVDEAAAWWRHGVTAVLLRRSVVMGGKAPVPRAVPEGWNRFLGDGTRFLVVGALGIGVNQAAFWTFAEIAHVHYLLAAALATQVSTTSNFLGIEFWAFTGRARTGRVRRFISYDALNTAALGVRVPILWAMVTLLHASSGLGNLVSIFVLLMIRYAVCDLLIWPVRRLPEGAAA